MAKISERLNYGVNNIGAWWALLGPGGVLVIIYSCVFYYFEPIAKQGWAAVVLYSVVLALFTILISSIAAATWGYFFPLRARKSFVAPVHIPEIKEKAAVPPRQNYTQIEKEALAAALIDVSKVVRQSYGQNPIANVIAAFDVLQNPPQIAKARAAANDLEQWAMKFSDELRQVRQQHHFCQNEIDSVLGSEWETETKNIVLHNVPGFRKGLTIVEESSDKPQAERFLRDSMKAAFMRASGSLDQWYGNALKRLDALRDDLNVVSSASLKLVQPGMPEITQH